MAATVTISAPATKFYISAVPAMPTITLTAVVTEEPDLGRTRSIEEIVTAAVASGSPQDRPVFRWTFALDYPPPGAAPRGSKRKSHRAMPSLTGQQVTVPFTELMCGRLTVNVVATIKGKMIAAKRDDILIGGTNPSPQALEQRVQNPTLIAIIRQESKGTQFNDAGGMYFDKAINPYWSGDGKGGVGLGQLTEPPPPDEAIWNWTKNVHLMAELFKGKKALVREIFDRIERSQRFKDEVQSLNAWRAAEKLPSIKVTMMAPTEEELNMSAVRAYNGLGWDVNDPYVVTIWDHTYKKLYEFEPQKTHLISTSRKGSNGQPLKSGPLLAVNGNGQVKWARVTSKDRQDRYIEAGEDPDDMKKGDYKYVQRIFKLSN